MKEKRKMTTIWLSEENKKKLDELFVKKGDTYDTIIQRLLDGDSSE